MTSVARRRFLQTLGGAAAGASLAAPWSGCGGGPPPVGRRPNVLFVSIDDLNDWIEPLGGHSQARTPNLSRFAGESVNFTHNQPFFLACGIYRPHLPWYAPRKYYDMFPLESVRLPLVLEHDLDDVGERAAEIAHRAGGYHRHVIEAGLWQQAVRGYLASMAFADAQLGRLLDALDASPHADNTIVVVWSDHGWQLGEKEHWRKFALWENVVRCVTMIRAPRGTPGLPSGTPAGARCDRITSLIDLFPTLVDLCGLPARPGLDGHSLVPLLRDTTASWDHPALTTYDFAEFSVRVEGWRYTRYIDDSEELYDHTADGEEWRNLAGDPKYREIKTSLARHIPATQAPIVDTSYEILPHHFPPFRSKEEYREFKAREARGEVQVVRTMADPWHIQLHDF